MKNETKDTAIAVVILITLLLSWMALYNDAQASENNAVMKSCLDEYGYTPEKFHEFNFAKAAACHSDWRTAEDERNRMKQRKFLEEHPWYKGKNWKWEETAEYSCEKIYSTRLLQTVTICSKPIYIN